MEKTQWRTSKKSISIAVGPEYNTTDSRHLASKAKLQRCGKALAQVAGIDFNVKMVLKMVLKSPQILPELFIP